MTAVNNDLLFLNSLYNTCKDKKLIRYDGKAFSIVDRLKEILWKIFGVSKPRDQHLIEVCRRLSQIDLTKISDTNGLVKSVETYAHLQGIVGKLRNSIVCKSQGDRLLKIFDASLRQKKEQLKKSTNPSDTQILESITNNSLIQLLRPNLVGKAEIKEINEYLSFLGIGKDPSLFIQRFFDCAGRFGSQGTFDLVTHVRTLESILDKGGDAVIRQVLQKIQQGLGKNQIKNTPKLLVDAYCKMANKYIVKLSAYEQNNFRTQIFEDRCVDVTSYPSLQMNFDQKIAEANELIKTFIIDEFTVNQLLVYLDFFKKCKDTIYWPQIQKPFSRYMLQCCKWLNFLSTTSWKNPSVRPMLEKKYLIIEELFKLFKQDVDETEANTLRLALANLPPVVRQRIGSQTHKSLQQESTDTEQLNFIVERLKEQETEIVDEIVRCNPIGSITDDQFRTVTRIAKLIGSSEGLIPDNTNKLRFKIYGKTLIKSLSIPNVKQFILSRNTHTQNPDMAALVEMLKRTVKAKRFFLGQYEKKPAIPRWYHATPRENMDGIADAQKIEVRHKKAFKGAWVSRRREPGYGDYVFGFTDKLQEVDTAPQHNYNETGIHKWRGLQESITFPKMDENFFSTLLNILSFQKAEEKDSLICMMGVPEGSKIEQKKQKKQIKDKLGKHIGAFSWAQLDFIQRFVLNTIGEPNLSEGWYWEDPKWKHLIR